MSDPVVAEGEVVEVDLLKGYFREQMQVNFNDDPKKWWQVFDRTSGKEVAKMIGILILKKARLQ